jgi:hypothetical protein
MGAAFQSLGEANKDRPQNKVRGEEFDDGMEGKKFRAPSALIPLRVGLRFQGDSAGGSSNSKKSCFTPRYDLKSELQSVKI